MTSANPSYKPSEGKREEFRKYLEKNGVMDALTRVLVNLYEEVDKPEDALEYIRDKLSVMAGQETYKQLQAKLTEAEEKIEELESKPKADSKGSIEVQENPDDVDGAIKTEENIEPKEEGAEEVQPEEEGL